MSLFFSSYAFCLLWFWSTGCTVIAELCYRSKPIIMQVLITTEKKPHSVSCDISASLPDDGMFEAQLGGALLDLLLQPRLWAHQVLDKLGHPPDGGVAVKTMQARAQVLRDGQGEVGWPRVQTVHNRQLHNLDVLIVGLSWVVQERGWWLHSRFKMYSRIQTIKVNAVMILFVKITAKIFLLSTKGALWNFCAVLVVVVVHVSGLHF